MADMKKKNATYYSVILDTDTREIKEFSNESGKVKLPFSNLDTIEKLKGIEEMVYEKVMEEDMER